MALSGLLKMRSLNNRKSAMGSSTKKILASEINMGAKKTILALAANKPDVKPARHLASIIVTHSTLNNAKLELRPPPVIEPPNVPATISPATIPCSAKINALRLGTKTKN